MNLLHMKYALEIAKTGSISKASEELYVAQPNLSRAVKELEADLGITIFDRSSRGMMLTPDGEAFTRYAKKVLDQVEEIEKLCRKGIALKQHFSVCAPHAGYISEAFARFSSTIGENPAELFYMEANPSNTLKNVLNSDYKLGILRYSTNYERYIRNLLEEKNLASELVAEFRHVLVMNQDAPLAAKETITLADLKPLVELSYGEPDAPALPLSAMIKEGHKEDATRRIYLFGRGGQYDLLKENRELFMWAAPLPKELLDRYHLAQRICADSKKRYKDVLIHKKNYVLTELDKRFVAELAVSKGCCSGKA